MKKFCKTTRMLIVTPMIYYIFEVNPRYLSSCTKLKPPRHVLHSIYALYLVYINENVNDYISQKLSPHFLSVTESYG